MNWREGRGVENTNMTDLLTLSPVYKLYETPVKTTFRVWCLYSYLGDGLQLSRNFNCYMGKSSHLWLYVGYPSNHPTSSAGGVYVHKLQSFPPNRSPKHARTIHFMFGGRLVSRIFKEFQQPTIQTKIVQHFGRFFHQIKVC